MKFEEYCTMMIDRLAALSSHEERLEEVANSLCRVFGTKTPDEIAIFSLDASKETLMFVWPNKLKSAGIIPISAITPLVAKTVRENRGFLDNLFANTTHAAIFEKFKIDGALPLPIQKIMSVPVHRDGCLCGVIQVSRKGDDVANVGRDFSQQDLVILQRMSDLIAVYL
jgi:hypothetical protein